MVERIVGIRFRVADRIRFFDALNWPIVCGDFVVVDTEKGPEIGWVATGPRDVLHADPGDVEVRQVLRRATSEDLARRESLARRERDMLRLAKSVARDANLGLKPVDAHFTIDGSRVTVSYIAEGKVDFRPLLRALSDAADARVELHQVGTRDEAKLTGGIGKCGRPLCCAQWMTDFNPITIKMAKEQALPISAEGLSGACGRLLCCLRFEWETYSELNKTLPKIGEWVGTPDGEGKVLVGHALKGTVSVLVEGHVSEHPFKVLRRGIPRPEPPQGTVARKR